MSLRQLQDVPFDVRDRYHAVSLHYNADADQVVGGAEDSDPRARADKFKYSLSKKTRRMAFEKRVNRMKGDSVLASEARVRALDEGGVSVRDPQSYINMLAAEGAILRSFYASAQYTAEKSRFDAGSPVADFARKVKRQYGPAAAAQAKTLVVIVGESMLQGRFARKGQSITASLTDLGIDVVLVNDAHTASKCSLCHYSLRPCFLRAADGDAKRREFSITPRAGFEAIGQLRLCDSRQCKAHAAAQVHRNNTERDADEAAPFHDLRIISVDVNAYVNRLVVWKSRHRPLFLCSNRRQRLKVKDMRNADLAKGLLTERPLACLAF